MTRPLLVISMGDPAGIGPEVVVKAASVRDVRAQARLIVCGDVGVMDRAAREFAVPVTVVEVSDPEQVHGLPDTSIAVLPISKLAESRWGEPTALGDQAQLDYVRAAFDLLQNGADALVTAPINKGALSRSGAPWPGHTEMLAAWCGEGRPLMMLAGPTLKVVPLTVHVALSQVPSLITQPLLMEAIQTVHQAFRVYFGRRWPRIAVAGLNPHAGEDGLFGREDVEVLAPAIAAAVAQGISVKGPLPGDTVFARAAAGEFDVVIGMYHDQALIPLKLLDFDRAVNVTLGLPLIRTSVDHGTAYDIAGRGVASANSMIAAVELAARMVKDGARGRMGSGVFAAP